jgi:ribosomal protein S6
MAYSIRKRTHAEYAAFYYESEGNLSAEIDRRLRINENVLRWLTIADNPVGIPPAPDSEEAQAAAAQQELRESRDREERNDRNESGDRGNRGERRSRRGED